MPDADSGKGSSLLLDGLLRCGQRPVIFPSWNWDSG